MNKKTKGAVAAGAAALLLAGGAGSFALWSDSATISGGAIQSGKLDIVSATGGTWSDASGTIDLATYKIVPGKAITYSVPVVVHVEGNGLTAKITPGAATFGATNALTDNLTTSVKVFDGSTELVGGLINSSEDDQNLTAKVSITFADVNNLVGQDLTASLNTLTLNLAQQ